MVFVPKVRFRVSVAIDGLAQWVNVHLWSQHFARYSFDQKRGIFKKLRKVRVVLFTGLVGALNLWQD